MKKILAILAFCMLLLNVSLAFSDGDHQSEIEEGKRLVESNTDCDNLNDEQLGAIGEYYMEQMHPGESHETMHRMMGMEEGTEYHEQFHVNMAKRMYCNENISGMMGGGMMGMMNMMGGGNMMGSGGMMNMMGGQTPQTNMMQGMMGNLGYGFGYWGFWNMVWLLFWAGILVSIFWLIYKFVIQKGKNESLLDILQKRYVEGEINRKQFEEMKKEIGGDIYGRK